MLTLLVALSLVSDAPNVTPASVAPGNIEEPGFTRLFDGKTLAGWVTRGGHYDGDARWTVEDGCIVGRQGENGAGGLLYTERRYASFELRLEVRLDHPFDSGVFVRMAPEKKGAQVTLDWRDDGEIGAIYSDAFLQHTPEGAAHFRRDEWNDLRVRCTGFDMHIEVWLNGDRLTDFELPPDSPGYAPTGLIGLQVHGERGDTGAARFRNVRVRELPLFGEECFTADPGGTLALTERGRTLGWRSLFDGKTLEGWASAGGLEGYRAQDGVLAVLARGKPGELATREDFTDFGLRLDFRIARMANSGLFLRSARDGSNPAFSGCEIQILDDFDWEQVTGTKLKPWQFTGSLYGSVPPGEKGVLRALGEWNAYEVLYRGTRLAVALNGRTLYDVDTHALAPEEGERFEKRARSGFIGLQCHGGEGVEGEVVVEFRSLFVQGL